MVIFHSYVNLPEGSAIYGDDWWWFSDSTPKTAWGDLSFRLRVQPKDGPKSDWFAEFFRIRSPMALVNSIMVYI